MLFTVFAQILNTLLLAGLLILIIQGIRALNKYLKQ